MKSVLLLLVAGLHLAAALPQHDHGGTTTGGHDHGTPATSTSTTMGHDHGGNTSEHDHGGPTTTTMAPPTTTKAPPTTSTTMGHDHGGTTSEHDHGEPTTSTHDHGGNTSTHDHGSPTSSGPAPTGVTPPGCKVMAGDKGFPSAAEFSAAIPGVMPVEAPAGQKRPDYVVQPTSVAQVQAAVKFAGEKNIRLSVTNSGHDFLGRNDAPSGLSIDLSKLTGIRLAASYTPSTRGVPNISPDTMVNVVQTNPRRQAAVTFGVGVSNQALHDAIHASGMTVVGAAHGSVRTAGGWGQAGGHAALSSMYGLGVDNVLEYKVVLADGSLKIANRLSNTDLFWALRGGGGGTFGVVVEATIKAYPTPKITVTNWWINATDRAKPGDGHWNAMAYLHSQFPALNARGVQGYYYIYPAAAQGIFLTAGGQAGAETAKSLWEPVLKAMSAFPGMMNATMKTYDYASYKAFYDMRLGPLCPEEEEEEMPGHEHGLRSRSNHRLSRRHEGMSAPMGILPMDSRLLGATHLSSPQLAAALRDAYPMVQQGVWRGHLVGGGKVFNPTESTSVHPAWRKAYVHLIATGAGDFNIDPIRKISPDMGAYINEASLKTVNWKTDFWGTNYARLSTLKTKFDPKGVFWVTPGINADHYEVKNGRLCKLATPSNSNATPLGDNHNMGTRDTSTYDTLSSFPGTKEVDPHQGTCEAGGDGHTHSHG